MAGRKALALVVTVTVFAAATFFLMLREEESSGPVLFPMRNSDGSVDSSAKQDFLPAISPFEPEEDLFPSPSPANFSLSTPNSTPNSTDTNPPVPEDSESEAEAEEIAESIEITVRRDEDYENFLTRLAVPEANMEGSVVPWDLIDIEPLNWTEQDWSLHMNISLSSNSEISCKPTKFGLSEAQAAATFIPKGPFTSCCPKPHNFLHYSNE